MGLEFKRKNNNGLDVLDLRLANVIKANEDYQMPTKSKLNKKRSDIFGEINFNLNDKIKLGIIFHMIKI